MQWHERQEVKKGNVGEDLVLSQLASWGYVPYSAAAGGPHPFDFLIATQDKKSLGIVEVKTKEKRSAYPDTGFDVSHLEDYKRVHDRYGLTVHMFFVDQGEQMIYGGDLFGHLMKPVSVTHKGKSLSYPWYWAGSKPIVYFHRNSMTDYAAIDEEACIKMNALTRTSFTPLAPTE